MQTWLGAIHGLDYLLTHLLIGILLFRLWILPAGGDAALHLDSQWRRRVVALIVLSILSSSLWMLSTGADMGDSWAFTELWIAMSHTDFGHLLCFRILLLVLSLALVLTVNSALVVVAFLIPLLIPLTSALTGHAGAQVTQDSGRAVRVLVDWMHSVSVGIWTGGLFGLFLWLRLWIKLEMNQKTHFAFLVVQRFSHFAMVSTGLIAATGFLMAYWAGVPLTHPWTSSYGVFVISKTALFSVTLVIASINHFYHLRKYVAEKELSFVRGIHREAGLELVLIIAVFAVAGFLTRTALPG